MSYILEALRRSEEERHQDQLKSLTGHDGLIHVPKSQTPIWPYLLIGVLALNLVVFVWLFYDDKVFVDTSSSLASIEVDSGEMINEISEVESALNTTTNVSELTSEPGALKNSVPKDAAVDKDVVGGENEIASDISRLETIQDEQIYMDGGLLIQPKNTRSLPSDLPYTRISSSPTVVVASQPIADSRSYDISPAIYDDVPSLIDMDARFQRGIPSLTFNSHIYSDNPGARRVMINNVYLSEGQMLSGLEIVMIGETDIVFKKGDTLFKRAVMRDW